ncbi:acetylornithine transaminase [Ligilactobacillus sp. WILCCON 0076]|uniref:Acetylornithine transaminase n=1 Tax=Ligilactobacillus ubinensis TaxID=2876789 RepID=A0A9X2FJN5_9LACO|nr:acetylornithine transaminase [Ligilactobacillus ubinensis]MCP0886862.1 acetylornithine transaminase [Ligilactobacillus ubinensis]
MMMKHVFSTYNRFPFQIVAGNGYELMDEQGNKYRDFTSGIGVCGLGYNVKELNDAVTKQLGLIWHTSNLYESQLQEEVACKLTKGKEYLVSFCNSGTEANEAALKLARKATGKKQFLAFNHSFHGRTYGSLSVTGNEEIKAGFLPLLEDVKFAAYNDFDALEEITTDLAAVILEIVQGEGGVNCGQGEWLNEVQAKCHEKGVLLIVDEVQTGMGRTGKLFAFEHFNLKPDIYTVAKGLANGIPVGAMVGKKELGEYFGPGSHGSTFAGNPLAMAAANVVLDKLNPDFLDAVEQKAEFVWHYLKQELANVDCVEDITGLGLMIGIHLDEKVKVNAVIKKLQNQGLLTLSAHGNTLRLLPPLIIPASELLAGIEVIKDVLSKCLVTEG